MDKKLVKVEDVADYLNTKAYRVYELCRTDPSFPKVVVGQRQYRFDLEAIKKWALAGGSTCKEEGQ